MCQEGCSGTISSVQYRCTDFSVEEDWSFGERLITYAFDSGPNIRIGFTGNAWISPFSSEWSISTMFSTAIRNDTGRINSTPRAITSPVLHLQAGCNHTIRLPVTDPDDDDIIRCRWAVGRECAGICGGFPGAELDSESCTITYNANQGIGHQAAAIMIEDYLPGFAEPFSSVGLQFLVLVVDTMRSCSASPEFIPPTPTDGTCVAIPSGETFHTMLIAVSGYVGDTISEIQTVSPAGLEKSSVFHDENANTYYVNITWIPTISQENLVHLFCYIAANSAGLSSDQVCIQLFSGHTAPTPLRETAVPSVGAVTVHPSDTVWHIDFDRNVRRPSTSAYITFHEYDTNMVVHRIDTSSDLQIAFDNSTTVIALTPDYNFEEDRKYYINFERGVVLDLEGCGSGSEPVTGRDFWSFTTIDVTPPRIHFISNTGASNGNITISWESNEEVTWKCSLTSGSVTQEQECQNGVWNGLNIPGGIYILEISGTDMANNTAIAIHTFTIDTTPPTVTFTRVPPEVSNIENNVFVQFRCEERCTYQCLFHEENDGSAVASPCNMGWYQTSSLSHGKCYILTVTATDEVGNVGEPESYSWKTDFEPPIIIFIKNTSTTCTSDISPVQTGQAQAIDNGTSVVSITYFDHMMPCSIARTWRASDVAGNVGLLTQYITLTYQATLRFLPRISTSCDSSMNQISVPTSTAAIQNPCRRPLGLTFEDTVSNYTCPINFNRTWTLTDDCSQQVSKFEQVISLNDVCPIDACGRNESPPHGICVQGSCICNRPWFGENCSILIHAVHIEPVDDHTLEELEDYTEKITLLQGTPPYSFTLVTSPTRMVISHGTGDIIWNRAQTGNYTIVVEAANQISTERVSWSLYVAPGYTAFLEPVANTTFPRATPLHLIGYMQYFEGNRVQQLLSGFVPVTIEITSRNGRRELTTFSRQDGTFSAVFYPAPTEYGSYVAGARHPRAIRATDQTSWDFLGMSATPRTIQLRDSTIAEYIKTFHRVSVITNDGPRTLHHITAVTISNTDDLRVKVVLVGNSTLEPNEIAFIDVEIETTGALDALFPITVESVEGVTLFLSVNLRIAQILPDLVADPSSINTRVVRGMFRNLDFNITNVGSIAAHRVRAILPMSDHISLISFGNSVQQMEGELTLNSGESAILSVQATIPPEQPLGDISGQIVLSSEETFEIIRFNLIVSSNMLMNLTVAVEDEYSYFAEGLPLLSNAVVRLTNNIRGIQETLTTRESGTVTFLNIPEDRYELFVTGPNHVPVNRIIVTSAEEPQITVFIARRAVSYSFSVVPTTFDETYTITLEADFETHVPIPVVTITPSDISLEPYELGLEDTIQYNITNHGLIRCDNVKFQLPTGHPFLEFSTDIEDIGSLDALTSIIIPVRVTRIDSREKRNIVSCVGALFYAIGVAYSYICGDLQERSASAVLRGFSQFSDCGRRYQVISPYGINRGRTNAISPSIGETSYTPTQISCDKCLNSALGCLPIPIPYFGCINFGVSGLKDLIKSGLPPLVSFLDIANHMGWIGCVHQIFFRQIPIIGQLLCLPGVLRDCFGVQTGLNIGRRRRSIGSTVRDTVQSYYAMHQFTLLGVEVLGDERWIRVVDDPVWLRDTFQPVLSDSSHGGPLITNTEFNFVMSVPPPRNATREMVQALLERINNTYIGWNNGILEPENGANIVSYAAVQNFTNDVSEFNERIIMSGYESFLDSYNDVIEQYNMIDDFNEEGGVCAVVRIRINQEIVLTRDAFLATLEIENMEASDLQQIQIDILITNVTSAVDSALLFSIGNVTLTGSLMSSEDGWILPSGESGAAEWLIAPLSEAAPTQNQDYNVGGTFSYVVNGEHISVPLLPTRITVAPDPSLIIHYFWEKFVIGDNPFTDETEPSVPFVLGVAIHNAGYGAAMNLRITSGQPEIIDNEKGLLVTFRIIGTSVGSESVTPSLSVDFGDIPGMTTKVARWLMISSLQGQFMNYSASFEYMNPLGDPRLSVLDELVIHDLIRNVRIYQEDEDDEVLDFLVNDRRDLFDIPDALYSSKTFTRYNVSRGSIESVHLQGSNLLEVRVVSNYSGWVYFRFEDMQNVLRETKRSINFTKPLNGGTIALPEENAWITRETQRSPGDTSLPYFLHIFDYIEDVGEITYMLNPCTSDCPTDEQPFEMTNPPGKIYLVTCTCIIILLCSHCHLKLC